MLKVKVFVTLKESVIDPQGSATKEALHTLNYSDVEEVRIGKYIELTLAKETTDIEKKVEEMCERLLVNTEIENYRYEVEEVESK